MTNYYSKYLKYKNKYLALKNVNRGGAGTLQPEAKDEIKKLELTIKSLNQKHDELKIEARRKASKRQSIGSSSNPEWQRLDAEVFKIYDEQDVIVKEIDRLKNIIKEIYGDIPNSAEPMDLSVTIDDNHLSHVTLNKDYSILKAGTEFIAPYGYFVKWPTKPKKYSVSLKINNKYAVEVTWTAKEGANNFQVMPWRDAHPTSFFNNVMKSRKVNKWRDGFSLGLEKVLKQEKPEWFR